MEEVQAKTNGCRGPGPATDAEGTEDHFLCCDEILDFRREDEKSPVFGTRADAPFALKCFGSSCSPSSVKVEPKGQDCLLDEETCCCPSEGSNPLLPLAGGSVPVFCLSLDGKHVCLSHIRPLSVLVRSLFCMCV